MMRDKVAMIAKDEMMYFMKVLGGNIEVVGVVVVGVEIYEHVGAGEGVSCKQEARFFISRCVL